MELTVDFASTQPIYLQIKGQIVAGIAAGALRVGEALPSVRTLGAELGVNLHTVNKAYRLLQSEGYLTLLRGRGAVVRVPEAAGGAFASGLQERLRALAAEAVAHGVTRTAFCALAAEAYDEWGSVSQ